MPDGYIELRDRVKDIIVSGGENVSTTEVEAAIVSHPAILEVAVVGVPNEKWGERPKAFVVLRSGATATAEEILGHVREQIARYKVPDCVEFIAEHAQAPRARYDRTRLRFAAIWKVLTGNAGCSGARRLMPAPSATTGAFPLRATYRAVLSLYVVSLGPGDTFLA